MRLLAFLGNFRGGRSIGPVPAPLDLQDSLVLVEIEHETSAMPVKSVRIEGKNVVIVV